MHTASTQGEASQHTLRQHYETIEQRRRNILVYLGNGVGGAFMLVFGVLAIRAGRGDLAMFTMPHVLVGLGNIVLYRLTLNKNVADIGIAYIILAVFTFLIAKGGVANSGPLWGFPMIVAAIALMGVRRGLMVVTLMFVVMVVAFWVPMPEFQLAHYSTEFKIRIVASFGAVALFTALHEYSAADNQQALLEVSEQLDRLSRTDALTGLPNRRHMREQLEAEASRQMRHGHPYSLLFGDIDDFKQINDTHGHHAGDEVLTAIGKTLRSHLRAHDAVSRWGGEEFLVLLPETNAVLAREVAEKLRIEIATLDFRIAGQALPLTMSFGVHTADSHGRIDSFIDCADQNLYQAKRNGKNQVVAGVSAST
ncbi:MAG: GGDEF domain-containing protein [Proteobacteria bacterium]|nr:GGDEF domain-containing protein [Pseudomonadota bacterium]